MRINVKSTLEYFTNNPGKLFLIDSIGAALTAFFLFFVLGHFNEYFGMPTNILTYLSGIAVLFCAYSAACFLLLKGNWAPFLRVISIGNSMYCVLTMALLFIYFRDLTVLGLTYFLMEIVLIFSIVYLEFRIASALKNR